MYTRLTLGIPTCVHPSHLRYPGGMLGVYYPSYGAREACWVCTTRQCCQGGMLGVLFPVMLPGRRAGCVIPCYLGEKRHNEARTILIPRREMRHNEARLYLILWEKPGTTRRVVSPLMLSRPAQRSASYRPFFGRNGEVERDEEGGLMLLVRHP